MFTVLCCIVLCKVAIAYVCVPPAPLQIGIHGYCTTEQNCRERRFVIYGSTCRRVCPVNTYYSEERRTCFDKCPNDTVSDNLRCLNGTYCLSKSNQVLYNGSCHVSCPDHAPFVKYGTCYSTCPVDTFLINKTHCISSIECKQGGGFINNNTCVRSCPDDKPFTFLGVCYHECPENILFGVNGSCLKKERCASKSNWVIFNRTCVSSCPAEARFERSGVCYSQCPTTTYAMNSTCLSDRECMEQNMVIHANVCISSCPVDASYQENSHCYSSCPEGTVSNNKSCIDRYECIKLWGLYKVIYNGSCVDTCPPEAPISNRGTCVDMCAEGSVSIDKQCTDPVQCTGKNMFIFNHTCVQKCPIHAPFVVKKVCYEKCPEGLLAMENQCMNGYDCIHLQRHIFNGTCVSSCPKDAYFTADGHCYQKCPGTFLAFDQQCVKEYECVFNKRMIFNDTCLESCPDENRYSFNNSCCHTCPKYTLTVADSERCVTLSGCKSLGWNVFNTTCLESCPLESRYSFNNKCYQICPRNTLTVADSERCVTLSGCKSLGWNVINTTCIQSCPEALPNKLDGKCYSTCPSGLVSKNSMCVKSYYCSSIVFENKCLDSCPRQAPYRDYDKCYVNCPDDKLKFDNSSCLYPYKCQEKKLYIYGDECFKTCPTGTFPLYISTYQLCISSWQPRVSAIAVSFLLLVFIPLVVSCIYIPKKSRLMNAEVKWKENNDNEAFEDIEEDDTLNESETEPLNDDYAISLPDTPDGGEVTSGHLGGSTLASTGDQTFNISVNEQNDEDDVPLLLLHQIKPEQVNDDDDDDALLFGDGGS